jgi:NADH-quinone oxidoreductase subunit M
MPFVMLTAAIMPLCIIASWHVTKRVKEYMIAFLVLETLMVGDVLRARFGAVLYVLRRRADPDVPDHRRLGRCAPVYAAFKFFLYTLPVRC